MSAINILADLFLSITVLLLVVFAVYAFKNMRSLEGQLEYKILTASIIIFIVASSIGIIDVFLHQGSWIYIVFTIWVLGLLALIAREVRRWLSMRKANVISRVRLLTLYSDTKYYLISILLLTFIALPLWLLLLSRPLQLISTWLDVVGIGAWALAVLNLAIAERKSYQRLRSHETIPTRKVAPLAREDILAVTTYGSFINLFLLKAKHMVGNAIRNSIVEYFESNPILFEGYRLSEDGIIDVDPILQNLDRIPEQNRIPMISTLFSVLNYKLLNLCSALVSPQWTQKAMEDCYLSTEGQFDNESGLSIILMTMPKGLLEDRKLSFLSKDELEARVRERTLELEKSEQQLRILKDFHEEIVKKAPVGILRTDKEGRIEFVNPKAAELIGIPNVEEIITKGKKINDIFSVKEGQKTMSFEIGSPEHMDLLAHNMPSEEIPTILEITSIYGKNTQTSVSVVSLSDKNGNFDGALFLIEDITERKLLEEERQKIERLESVGTLAGGIAHDFNNLLTGIMGNIGLAKRSIEAGDLQKTSSRLVEAEKASLRAKDLTQQLLTFARGGAPIRQNVALTGLLKDSIDFVSRGSNVRCDLSLQDDLWMVNIDEGQINQVISNVIINAGQAMPEGGIININVKNTVVQERSTLPLKKGKYVEIIVEDYGVGIKKEHLPRIFEPYFTTKQKGSGLGLATAYSIIINHDGHIIVNSTPTVGTTVRIYLPASKKTIPAKKEVVAETHIAGKGRILVMDDEEVIRELLHDELTDAGYDIELAVDGTEAIERYTKAKDLGQPFDAVIMDLTIPGGMGGKEAIKQLLEIDPSAKVIVSSGYSTDPIMSDFKKYGFSAVAAKPYKVEELERTLRDLLKGEEVVKDS